MYVVPSTIDNWSAAYQASAGHAAKLPAAVAGAGFAKAELVSIPQALQVTLPSLGVTAHAWCAAPVNPRGADLPA